jgi:mannonate dehydratase
MAPITIMNLTTILTAPAGIRLIMMKPETSEPDLYGFGCATFTQRHHAVAAALDKHLKLFVIGKEVQHIEDL